MKKLTMKAVATVSLASLLSSAAANASIDTKTRRSDLKSPTPRIEALMLDLEEANLSNPEVEALSDYLEQLNQDSETTIMSSDHDTETW